MCYLYTIHRRVIRTKTNRDTRYIVSAVVSRSLPKLKYVFPTDRTIAADRRATIRANCAHILSAYRLKETRQRVYRLYVVHIAIVCCKEF